MLMVLCGCWDPPTLPRLDGSKNFHPDIAMLLLSELHIFLITRLAYACWSFNAPDWGIAFPDGISRNKSFNHLCFYSGSSVSPSMCGSYLAKGRITRYGIAVSRLSHPTAVSIGLNIRTLSINPHSKCLTIIIILQNQSLLVPLTAVGESPNGRKPQTTDRTEPISRPEQRFMLILCLLQGG